MGSIEGIRLHFKALFAVPRPNPQDCDVGSRPKADRQILGFVALKAYWLQVEEKQHRNTA